MTPETMIQLALVLPLLALVLIVLMVTTKFSPVKIELKPRMNTAIVAATTVELVVVLYGV